MHYTDLHGGVQEAQWSHDEVAHFKVTQKAIPTALKKDVVKKLLPTFSSQHAEDSEKAKAQSVMMSWYEQLLGFNYF